MASGGKPEKELVVVVTDSGLGGTSILADIADGLKSRNPSPRVSLVYFNAWPEQERGYNRLSDDGERIRVFDRALGAMMGFSPDMVLVACNTLSVLLDKTPFAKTAAVPVVDIVQSGSEMIFKKMTEAADARVVILGTLTTIASEAHAGILVRKGISPNRIIGQPCDQLATAIEKTGPDSADSRMLIETYANQAKEKLGSFRGRVFVALCCTHYAFAINQIAERFNRFLDVPVEIINPNRAMVAEFLGLVSSGGLPIADCGPSGPAIRVVSKIRLDEDRRKSVAGLIRERSKESAVALEEYEFNPGLFTF